MKKLIFAFTIALLSSIGLHSEELFKITDVPLKENNIASNFSFILNGETVKLFDYSTDRVIIFNFWRESCYGCETEMADFAKLNNEIDKNKFIFLGFSYDEETVAKQTMNSWGINFDCFYGEQEIRYATTKQFLNAPVLPQTLIINPNKNIDTILWGAQTYETMKDLLAKYSSTAIPESNKKDVNISLSEGSIIFESMVPIIKIDIYDYLGSKLSQYEVDSQKTEFSISDYKTKFIFVVVYTMDRVYSQKILLP